MVLQKSNPEYIVSLRLKSHYFDFASSAIFTNIISLTLVNFEDLSKIQECKTCFPKLISLSLWYDEAVDYNRLSVIFQKLRNPIKRLELHSAKTIHTSYFNNERIREFMQNTTIEYFLLDIDYINSNLMKNFVGGYDACFLNKTIHFIKHMINIRYVHLMINYFNLEKFLDENEWKNLINECHQLRKIKLQVTGDMLEDKEWTKKVQNIQKELREIRENIKFQVIWN